MKEKVIATVLGIASVFSVGLMFMTTPAHAISHAYRAKLEREHKTQVQDAHVSPTANFAIKDANAVMDAPIGEAADYLLSQGWKPNNGDWHKKGKTIRLVVEDGVVVNAQTM